MVQPSEQRVAGVTGGSRGTGRPLASTLAPPGAAVGAGHAGAGTAATEVVAQIKAAGGQAIAVQADVANEVEVGALFDAAEQTFGGIDVVVNSAGRMSLSPIADLDLDDLDALHRTNIRGTFVIAREAAR